MSRDLLSKKCLFVCLLFYKSNQCESRTSYEEAPLQTNQLNITLSLDFSITLKEVVVVIVKKKNNRKCSVWLRVQPLGNN